MPKYLRDLWQTNRYKLLYYFYKHGEVAAEPGLKAYLRRLIGYSSDGHMYPDFESLEKDGMISREGDRWRITREGRFEFFYLRLLKVLTGLFGFLAVYYGWNFFMGDITSFILGVRIPGLSCEILVLMSIPAFIFFAAVLYYTTKQFTPQL